MSQRIRRPSQIGMISRFNSIWYHVSNIFIAACLRRCLNFVEPTFVEKIVLLKFLDCIVGRKNIHILCLLGFLIDFLFLSGKTPFNTKSFILYYFWIIFGFIKNFQFLRLIQAKFWNWYFMKKFGVFSLFGIILRKVLYLGFNKLDEFTFVLNNCDWFRFLNILINLIMMLNFTSSLEWWRWIRFTFWSLRPYWFRWHSFYHM